MSRISIYIKNQIVTASLVFKKETDNVIYISKARAPKVYYIGHLLSELFPVSISSYKKEITYICTFHNREGNYNHMLFLYLKKLKRDNKNMPLTFSYTRTGCSLNGTTNFGVFVITLHKGWKRSTHLPTELPDNLSVRRT